MSVSNLHDHSRRARNKHWALVTLTSETLLAKLALKRQKMPVISSTRIREFAINGRRFKGPRVADDVKVQLGDTETWEFRNNTPMPHPMHIHGLQFNVIRRSAHGNSHGWSGLQQGLVDSGWHDTVLVMPGVFVSEIGGSSVVNCTGCFARRFKVKNF